MEFEFSAGIEFGELLLHPLEKFHFFLMKVGPVEILDAVRKSVTGKKPLSQSALRKIFSSGEVDYEDFSLLERVGLFDDALTNSYTGGSTQ